VAVRGRGFHHATSFHQPSLPSRQTATTAARRPDVAAHCSAAVIHAERPGSPGRSVGRLVLDLGE